MRDLRLQPCNSKTANNKTRNVDNFVRIFFS
jgi:hypothetical protein